MYSSKLKKVNKAIATFFTYCIFIGSLFSQIGGITASKINSVNHAPIDVGLAEFEPSYNFSKSRKQWDQNGNLSPLYSTIDSIVIDASFNLRMAYTMTDELEVGCNLGEGYSNWSAKYAVYTKNNFGLGLMLGANFPFGFAEIDTRNRTVDQIGTYGMGLIASYEVNEKSSIDFNAQIQNYFQDNEDLPNNDIFLSVDYGHYVKDLFLIVSFLYQTSDFDDFQQNKLTFSPGISFEMKPEYLIVANANFDLTGKQTEKTHGFSVAFTITL